MSILAHSCNIYLFINKQGICKQNMKVYVNKESICM